MGQFWYAFRDIVALPSRVFSLLYHRYIATLPLREAPGLCLLSIKVNSLLPFWGLRASSSPPSRPIGTNGFHEPRTPVVTSTSVVTVSPSETAMTTPPETITPPASAPPRVVPTPRVRHCRPTLPAHASPLRPQTPPRPQRIPPTRHHNAASHSQDPSDDTSSAFFSTACSYRPRVLPRLAMAPRWVRGSPSKVFWRDCARSSTCSCV